MPAQVSEADATAHVAITCQATSEPCLDAAELAWLVRGARRPDEDGRFPSDAAWEPTYDLAWASWKGWSLKAGKATLMVDVNSGGQSVSKSQVHAACMAQANLYARGVLQSAPITTGATGGATFTLGTPGTTPGQGGEVLPDADSLAVYGGAEERRDGLPVP
jgi:hypothetical protein